MSDHDASRWEHLKMPLFDKIKTWPLLGKKKNLMKV